MFYRNKLHAKPLHALKFTQKTPWLLHDTSRSTPTHISETELRNLHTCTTPVPYGTRGEELHIHPLTRPSRTPRKEVSRLTETICVCSTYLSTRIGGRTTASS